VAVFISPPIGPWRLSSGRCFVLSTKIDFPYRFIRVFMPFPPLLISFIQFYCSQQHKGKYKEQGSYGVSPRDPFFLDMIEWY
jgi:hypothetical protein